MSHASQSLKAAPVSEWFQPDLWLHDVRYAVRCLMRQPRFSLSVIALLAVAIGANVAMFSAFHHSLLRPLPYDDPDGLVMGRTTFNGNINPDMSAYDFYDFHERSRVIESAGAIMTGSYNVTITGDGEPEQLSSILVSWDLFRTLGVPATAGRHFSLSEARLDGSNVIMISGSYWLRHFSGSKDAVGSTILVDGIPQTIVGVMPPGFRFLHDVDLWAPMRRDSPWASSRGWHSWLMVGRLKPGVTLERAQADVDVISNQLATEYPDTNRDKMLLLTGLQDVLNEDSQTPMTLLLAAVGLVLLIACGNVASLLLARNTARRTEMSVRAALGATSGRVARQLLTESMVVAAVGGLLGTLLAICFQRVILHLVLVDAPKIEDLGFSWPMLAFALGISLATGLLFGVIPALQASRRSLVSNVRSSGPTTDVRSQRFHNSLVVAQVAVSVILLIGSGLLLKSLATLRAVSPGFDTANLLTTEIRLTSDSYPDATTRVEFFTGLVEEVRSIPGVIDAALINQLPIRDPGNNIAVFATKNPPADPNDRRVSYQRTVLPGYFDAMGIPLLRGRGIESTDTTDAASVLVINEMMARTLFPDEDPLGQMVTVGRDNNYEVVGVVGNVRVSGPRYSPRLVMYGSFPQQSRPTMRLAIRTANESSSVGEVLRTAVWKRDRDIPVVELSSMDEIIANRVSSDSVVTLSVTLFASVAAALAALGLYGVLSYYVSRRTHEIGVRVALGAGARHVFTQVLKRGLPLVGVGIVIGLLGAFWASRLLQSVLFETAPTDISTFLLVSIFFTFISLIACVIPARKALKVDPVIALTA